MFVQPTVFLAFANDRDEHLELLKDEAHAVWKALGPLEAAGRLKLHQDASATLDRVFDALNAYHGRLTVFHFAGHADGTSLKFEDGTAGGQGVAALLGTEPNLKLVVLNGCATQHQVEALWDAGVPAVIGTRVQISDDRAQQFAARLYESLAAGVVLGRAFERASAFIRAKYPDVGNGGRIYRARVSRELGHGTQFPWGLWIRENDRLDMLDWRLCEADDPRRRHLGAAEAAPITDHPTAHAIIYFHRDGFGETDARRFQAALQQEGIPSVIGPHVDPNPPDAIYIGSGVDVETGQFVLRYLPYLPRFLFPPDLPEVQGGSATGQALGIGFVASHNSAFEDHVPAAPLSAADLSSLGERGISTEEFQRRLRRISARRR